MLTNDRQFIFPRKLRAIVAPVAGRSLAFIETVMTKPVPPNAPSKNPGQPSGGGRGNNPPKGK
jgi:hypothetical protein